MSARLGMGLIMWYDICEAMRREYAVQRLRELLRDQDIPVPLGWDSPRAAGGGARHKQGSAFQRITRKSSGLDLDAEVLPILLQQTDFGVAPVRMMQRPNSRTDLSRLRAVKILRTTSSGRMVVRRPASPARPTTPGSTGGGSDAGQRDGTPEWPPLPHLASGLSRISHTGGSMASADDAFMEAVWNEHTGTYQETSAGAAILHGAARFKEARVKARRSWFNHLRREAARPVVDTGRLDRLAEVDTASVDDPDEAWTVHNDDDLGVDSGTRQGSVLSASSRSRRGTPEPDDRIGSGRGSPVVIGGDFAKLPVFVRMCWQTVLRETSQK